VDVGGDIGISGAMGISLAAQLSAGDVITLPDVRRVRGGAVVVVGSGGSSSTYPVSESDHDTVDDFTVARGKKARRRINKRKSTSPNGLLESNPQKVAKYTNSVAGRPTAVSYASVVNNARVTVSGPATRAVGSSRLIGTKDSYKLKAAERINVNKSVYSISNVSSEFPTSDITAHCKSMKIRVLFCFDISVPSSVSKPFKLAIPTDEAGRMNQADQWLRRISIRP